MRLRIALASCTTAALASICEWCTMVWYVSLRRRPAWGVGREGERTGRGDVGASGDALSR